MLFILFVAGRVLPKVTTHVSVKRHRLQELSMFG